MKIALLLAAAAALRAQMATEPADTLARARVQIVAAMQRLPRYACIQTINRSYFTRVTAKNTAIPSCGHARADTEEGGASLRLDTLRLDTTDRLRLQVAQGDRGEIHSWPGASRFETGDINELIKRGPVATGSFGGYLLDIFNNTGVEFDFSGEKSESGRRIVTYAYRVAQQQSHYKIRAEDGWVIAAYHGTFDIDAASLELLRIAVDAPDLPKETRLCEAESSLDYQRVRIGDGDFLLPRQSQVHLVDRGSTETNNTTVFSGCQEYRAESVVRFDDADTPGANAANTKSQIALPAGLPFAVRLNAEIDSDIAAGGDPVTATVAQPVRDPKSKQILIPAGAVAHGRISRMEHRIVPSPSFTIGIAWSSIEIAGVSSPLAANPADAFFFPTSAKRYVIRAGSESRWVTASTISGDK